MSLYNITQEYQLLVAQLEEQDGEFTEEQLQLLEITKEQFKEKAEVYCKIISNLDADVEFAKKEVERIQKYITSKQNAQSKLEEKLKSALMVFGEKDKKKDLWRFEAGTYKLATRKSERIEINEELIDNKWKEISIKDKFNMEDLTKISDLLGRNLETNTTILKTPIKEALQAGELIEGASIVTNFGLSIK